MSDITIEEELIKHIPISDIFVDSEYNARPLSETTSDDVDSGSMGFTGLCADIARSGQLSPVDVRLVSQSKSILGKETACHYELITGFRRMSAIAWLNSPDNVEKQKPKNVVSNTANGTILARIRVCDKRKARCLNLQENMQRTDLSPAAQMHGIFDLTVLKMSIAEISVTVGRTPSWVSTLIKIKANTLPVITAHWTVGGEFEGLVPTKKASVTDMLEVSELDKKKQKDAYIRILIGKTNIDDEGDKLSNRVSSLLRRAESFGKILGKLEKAEFIDVTNSAWFDALPIMLNLPKNIKNKQRQKIADAMEKAWHDTLSGEEDSEETFDVES